MGVYTIVVSDGLSVQLKVGPCDLEAYCLGEEIPGIDDGVYVAYEGVVVISDGKVASVQPVLIDKWGGVIHPRDVLEGRNPVAEELEQRLARLRAAVGIAAEWHELSGKTAVSTDFSDRKTALRDQSLWESLGDALAQLQPGDLEESQ